MVHIPPHAPISRAGLNVVSLGACPSDTAHMIHIHSVGLELAEACSAKFFLEQKRNITHVLAGFNLVIYFLDSMEARSTRYNFSLGLGCGWVGLGLIICFLDSGRQNGSFRWKLRCASNVIFSCSLVNLTVLREICAPQTHPMGFVTSTHPTRRVRLRRTHPSRIPEDILLDRVQGTK